MAELSIDNINQIFNYSRYDKNISLINKENYNLYLKLKEDAMKIIFKYMTAYRINNDYTEYCYNFELRNRNNTYRKKKLIRYYIQKYPEECLQEEIKLFSTKLRRPELSLPNPDEPKTRRDLKNILEQCTISEIFYTGW